MIEGVERYVGEVRGESPPPSLRSRRFGTDAVNAANKRSLNKDRRPRLPLTGGASLLCVTGSETIEFKDAAIDPDGLLNLDLRAKSVVSVSK